MNSNTNKIFIIGLPRTGTTSICAKFLALDFTVAHTAYCQNTFDDAVVIADTPVFADYTQLDKYYPNSRFILLDRELDQWLPSIKKLLARMYKNVVRADGGFNPIIKRCFQETFSPFTAENIENDSFLTHCFQAHQKKVQQYFSLRPNDLLVINIAKENAIKKLHDFLAIEAPISPFPMLNQQGKITAWNDIKSPNKIASTINGRTSAINYLINK